MDWAELLDVVIILHRTGMSVPMALEQHAYFGSGPSQRLAQEWLAQCHISGDPVAAMRALAPRARREPDQFVKETLTVCLEYPMADHLRVLTTAVDHRETSDRPVRVSALVVLTLVGPALVELLRLMIVGLEG